MSGYIGLYLFNRFVHVFARDEGPGPHYGVGLVPMLGIGLHSLVDGVIYCVTFSVGIFTGVLAAALTTPLAMLASYPYIHRIDAPLLGALLSVSAGALVYVGATHLLLQAEKEHRPYSLLAFGAGIAVALGIIFSKG